MGRLSAFRQNHSPPARAKLWHASRLVARSRQALCGTGAYGRNTPIRPIGNLAPVSNRPYAGRERSAPSGRLPLEPHRRGANFPREPFRSAPPRTAAPGAWCAPSCPPLRIHRARQTRGGPGVCEAERDVWREPALPPVLRRFRRESEPRGSSGRAGPGLRFGPSLAEVVRRPGLLQIIPLRASPPRQAAEAGSASPPEYGPPGTAKT